MAKLYLSYEGKQLKEFTLSEGVVTIGRLPDNLVQVDNLAVSGHHAKIYWDTDHYVLEDNNSLNGTYVNQQRVQTLVLKDGDSISIGKHTLQFKDEWHEDARGRTTQPMELPKVQKLDPTVVLDTKKAMEMMRAAKAAQAAAAGAAAPAEVSAGAAAVEGGATHQPPPPVPVAPPKERIGVLTVISGKTDEPMYTLAGRLTVIGKDAMASIKLKGWFAPKVAAQITRRDGKYFIVSSEHKVKVIVNGAVITGQNELLDGDVIEIGGVKMSFAFQD